MDTYAYTLTDVLVFLFIGIGELGFYACRFFFGTDDDPIDILETSSKMVTGLNGKSLSLEIYTLSRVLYMLQQCPTVVTHPLLHYPTLAIHSIDLQLNFTSTILATQLSIVVLSTRVEHLIIASS